MEIALDRIGTWFTGHQGFAASLWVVLLAVSAWAANWLIKKILLRWLFRALRASPYSARLATEPDVGIIVDRVSNTVPSILIATGIPLIPGIPDDITLVVGNVAQALIVFLLALAIGRSLTFANRLWERRPEAVTRPIKGYIQVSRIVLYSLTAVLVVALLMDQSPAILLSGLGAMAAVLLFIFQHTLLSLVASVQLSSNDVIRLGDWIEMPELNANGLVFDIALHTVRIQNWDNTITSIPTKRFITDPFKNWRGMQESGGRRIMRSLLIDQTTVRFIDSADIQHLEQFSLLQDYLRDKQADIDQRNSELAAEGRPTLDRRRITNIGCFRAYVERYVDSHPAIHQDMSHLARQLSPTSEGVPIEVYAFTEVTEWGAYEAIQADIFDHLMAILPEFGLRLYQNPSGFDFHRLSPATSPA